MAVPAELGALGRRWFCWLLGLQAVSVYGAQLSSEACRELGFSSNLLCSSCNLLGQFNLNQLDPFCRECCQEEAQLETRKYSAIFLKLFDIWRGQYAHIRENPVVGAAKSVYDFYLYWELGERGKKISATLYNHAENVLRDEVDTGPVLLLMPADTAAAFVRSDKPKLFRGLQIKYVRGSDPVLKLLDDSGNIAEELSILKWNTDSVEEFLSEKLERL
ncbi:selenoprotein F [Turdus rufiventris]|nr:selenoprotein F [Turdus rufiventris]